MMDSYCGFPLQEMMEKVEAEHRVKLEQLNSIKDEQKWVLCYLILVSPQLIVIHMEISKQLLPNRTHYKQPNL